MSAALAQEDMRLLQKTISIREAMIDSVNHKTVVSDSKELSAYVSLLDSLDRSIFTKAKIKIEEDNNKNVADIQANMASILLGIHEKVNNKSRSNYIDVNIELPSTVQIELVEGETFIGLDETTINEFQNK